MSVGHLVTRGRRATNKTANTAPAPVIVAAAGLRKTPQRQSQQQERAADDVSKRVRPANQQPSDDADGAARQHQRREKLQRQHGERGDPVTR